MFKNILEVCKKLIFKLKSLRNINKFKIFIKKKPVEMKSHFSKEACEILRGLLVVNVY